MKDLVGPNVSVIEARRALMGLLVVMLLSLQLIPMVPMVEGAGSRAEVGRPEVMWPMDNIENGTLRPEFIFKANYSGGGGLTYTIELATDREFVNMVKTYASNKDGGFTSLDIPDDTQPFQPNSVLAFKPFDDLEAGKVFWWRVKAEAASTPGTISEWSDIRSLRLNESLVRHRWHQTTADQMMTGIGTNLDPGTGNVVLGKADVVVFKDTFETTTINGTNWPYHVGPPTIDDIGSHEPSEPYSLRLNGANSGGDMIESKEMDLSQFFNGTIVFNWEGGGGANSPDPGEWLKLEVLSSTGTWEEVFFRDGNSTNMDEYVRQEIELPAGTFHGSFQLRLSNNAFSAGDDWFVDDIEVRCRNYRSGRLVSDPLFLDQGPERRTGWSKVSFEGGGNTTVAVQSLVNGTWGWTGIEGSLKAMSSRSLSLIPVGPVQAIRLVANFSEAQTGPHLDAWTVEWSMADTPFVEVLHPQPGEVLGVNQDYVIRWNAIGEDHPLAQNPVSIFFSVNGSAGPFMTVVKGVGNTGEYQWKVPNNVSSDCYVRVEVIDDQVTPKVGVDLTDGPFTIDMVPPKVSVLAPNGAEELWAGDTYLVRWRTTKGSFNLAPRSVSVFLSTNGASGDYVPLFENVQDTGNITWNVPNLDSRACFIKVTVRDTRPEPSVAQDISDQQFTIRPDDVTPFVVISDPKDGDKEHPPEKVVSITFSEEMDKASAEGAFTIRPKAKGEFVWSENTMMFVPDQGLQGGRSYEIVVDEGARDVNGNELQSTYKARFETGSVQESALQRWSYAILSLFIIGLGLGLGIGGWYLRKIMLEAEKKREPTVIDELFLMSESGKLIKHYTRRLKPDVDQDILSGMLVAVQNFVKDTFKGETGQLDELTFGEFKILLARGKYSMLAAVLKGPDPKKLMDQLLDCVKDMERKQRSVLKDWDGDSLHVSKLDPYMRGLIAGKYKKE